MNLKGVPLQDWFSLAVGIIGLVAAYLKSKNQIPSDVLKWVNRFGGWDEIVRKIDTAAELITDTPEQRRLKAQVLVKDAASRIGLAIPDSITNQIIELAVGKWKSAK